MTTATDAASNKESMPFQAETRQLLDLVIHSLYTHKEIFLRELISNASDAIDKIRFNSLTDASLLEGDDDFHIRLAVNKEAKTFTISDNGIGMNRDEVIANIGTIAQSGSKNFIKALENKDENKNPMELIGQFGVGFYSAFMVAKKVVLVTRGPKQEKGVRWESEGEGTFTLQEVIVPKRGTSITLELRDDVLEADRPEEDFLNQYTVQNLVKKYSDYIGYPIKMDFERDEYPKDDEGKADYEAEPKKIVEERTLNSQKPLWERNKSDITADDYFQFYKHHFHDWTEPADIIHIKAEGTIEYTALLFIPAQAPVDFYAADYKKGIQLYSKHVFVRDNFTDFFPDHLRFVRGLVDSPDFTLNVSREVLQHDRQIKMIAKNLEKKVMDALKTLLKDKRDKYEAWWNEFGKAIKGGIYMEYGNKEKLQDFLLFPTSAKAEGYTTLAEYVERMPEWQEEIYYEVGKDRETIERLPQMEVIREKGVEVLYFTDKVDEFITQNLPEYNEKKLKSASRGDFTLDEKDKDKKDEDKPEEAKSESDAKHEDLLKAVKDALGEKVHEVRISKRLKTSAACLVAPDTGPSFQMEQLLRSANQISARPRRILELNADHTIFKLMNQSFKKDAKTPIVKDYSELLLSQSLLIEGYELEDPVAFAKQLNKLMVTAAPPLDETGEAEAKTEAAPEAAASEDPKPEPEVVEAEVIDPRRD